MDGLLYTCIFVYNPLKQVLLVSWVSIVKEDDGSYGNSLLITRVGLHKVGCPVEAAYFL